MHVAVRREPADHYSVVYVQALKETHVQRLTSLPGLLRILATTALAGPACAPVSQDAHEISLLSPAPATLDLSITPAVPGESVTFTVQGAPAGAQVSFVWGTGPGEPFCPPVLAPDCVGVLAPQIAFTVSADASGLASRTLTVPATLSPGLQTSWQAWVITPGNSLHSEVTPVTLLADPCEATRAPSCFRDHCGTVTSDETWDDSVYWHRVTCDLFVHGSSSPTLTLAAGARVLFEPGTAMFVGYSYPGDLVVAGTPAAPVLLEPTTPSAQWQGITLGLQSVASAIDHALIRRAAIGVSADSSQAALRYVTTEDCDVGVSVSGTVLLQDSTLRGGTDGLRLDAGADLAGTPAAALNRRNTFEGLAGSPVELPPRAVGKLGAGTRVRSNARDVIDVQGGTASESASWSHHGVPYRIAANLYVQGVGQPPELTLEDGVELAFAPGAGLYVGSSFDGTLRVLGGTQRVRLTASGAPSPGSWGGLTLGSRASGSVLQGLDISYGGSNLLGNIAIQGSRVQLDGITSTHSSHHGLFSAAGEVSVANSRFADNLADGVYLDDDSELSAPLEWSELPGNLGYAATLPAAFAHQLSPTTLHVGSAGGVRLLGGTLQTSATWPGLDVPYILPETVFVHGSANPVLTLEAGAELRFGSGAGLYIGYSASGGLVVDGAQPADVLLTAHHPSPTPGSWPGLVIGPMATRAELRGMTLEYAGQATAGAVTVSFGTEPILDQVLVQRSSTHGLSVVGASVVLGAAGFVDNQGVGLWLDDTSAVTSTGQLWATGNEAPAELPPAAVAHLRGSLTGNLDDRVRVRGGTIAQSATWPDPGVPVHLLGSLYVQGLADPVLTLEPGLEVQAGPGVGIWVGYSYPGGLIAQGADDILFTSARSVPAPGDWAGVHLGTRCLALSTELHRVQVRYGGDNGYGNVSFVGCSGTLTQSTLSDSSEYGVYVQLAAPTLSGNTYSGNLAGDLFVAP